MKRISVLGSTGSIGRQALDVIRMHPDKFKVAALCAYSDSSTLLSQAAEFRPEAVGLTDEDKAREIKDHLPEGCVLIFGKEASGICAAWDTADTVVNGISGIAGMEPLLAALDSGKCVALANKESIVCGHPLVLRSLEKGGSIIPVDSEQSAIFQCLGAGSKKEVSRLILTASGGPFREYNREQMENITPEQALRHPTWQMGRKITVDSATLFNKGLEIIEASYLFGVPGEHIDVLIHPQSIIHSMVEFLDGAVIAQLGVPDMRLAIQYSLTYPERQISPCEALKLHQTGSLTFSEPDRIKFPAINLAYTALAEGGSMPVVYNGADEAAVDMFLRGRIRYSDIAKCVEYAMLHVSERCINAAEDVFAVDIEAKRKAEECAAGKRW
jgi:1-deoxy-D-xylulose-5-phosphate reductoisomerase